MPPTRESRPIAGAAPRRDGEKRKRNDTAPHRQWWVPTGPRSGFLVDVDNIAEQLIRDAFRDSLATYWHRRAEQLAAGLSRPGDLAGRLTPEQIAERDQRIRNDVARCLRHASLLAAGDPFSEDITAVVREVA
ncbi:hypothetical protein [Kribbella shirazensis]|uniref:Uncharacterized protein n=1 Tax=Kribbella shirazensis TaxID=1105143 RepID=A0A7X5VB46_9ACTN|nr:hypothetical protein [Kribbella shirazensis]NIK57897.1 hypothetical protein [Kribbella shirazensis]